MVVGKGVGVMRKWEKMPRKYKKRALGKRLSKGELRKLIASVTIIQKKYPQPPEIKPYTFCPKCGCRSERIFDHGVPYPEIWVDSYCARCGAWVGGADNSRWGHVLEQVKE